MNSSSAAGSAALAASSSRASDSVRAVRLHSLRVLDQGLWKARQIHPAPLRAHCRALNAERLSIGIAGDVATCRALFAAVEGRSRILHDIPPATCAVTQVVLRLVAYASHFVRPVDEWCPDPGAAATSQLTSLISHLFEKWPVPSCFAAAWYQPGPRMSIERDWFVHLGAGGSVRRLAGMPPLRRRVAALLAQGATAPTSPAEAIRRAQLHSLEFSDSLVSMVMQSGMASDFRNDRLWLPLLEKIAAAPWFDAREFGLIADGLLGLVERAEIGRAPQLVRLPLGSLVRHWRAWWRQALTVVPGEAMGPLPDMYSHAVRQRLRRLLRTRWDPMPGLGPWEMAEATAGSKSCCWRIEEIVTLGELIAEGRLLRHCVGGYAADCRGGRSAIFRLRCRDARENLEPLAFACTIEVWPRRRLVVQIKGKGNAAPGPRERAVIRRWAEASELRMGV